MARFCLNLMLLWNTLMKRQAARFPPATRSRRPKTALGLIWLAAKHYLAQCSTQRSPDEQTLEEGRAKSGTAFAKIEARLGEGPYFDGDTLGMVDIAWLPLLHRAAVIERATAFDFLGACPK